MSIDSVVLKCIIERVLDLPILSTIVTSSLSLAQDNLEVIREFLSDIFNKAEMSFLIFGPK